MADTHPDPSFAHLVTGLEVKTPLLNGKHHHYINLDNAASTPSFKCAQTSINDFLEYYSSVHRGSGYKSQLSTHAYEQSREIVLQFLGAPIKSHTCIFVKNTTEAINKLAHRFPFNEKRPLLLTSGMEHHSNDLPWRSATQVIHVGLTPNGQLDLEELNSIVDRYAEKIGLVSITAASNVTGFINPIHDIARIAHSIGAQIVVDCAQIAAHRQINMLPLDDPAHLDYVTISAHKMYAPFGTGALVGRRDTFERGDPEQVGGGTVEIVTLDSVEWANPPDRDEAGSPNVIGAIALAAAIQQFQKIGMEAITKHEAILTSYALRRLAEIPGIRIFGDPNPESADTRLGVIPFSLGDISHFLVSAVLGCEFGIGVRSGCFCAHPYILHLLNLSSQEAQDVRQRMLSGNKVDMPGLVRASFGLYNTKADINALIEALYVIAQGKYHGDYLQDVTSGEFIPQGWMFEFEKYFSLDTV